MSVLSNNIEFEESTDLVDSLLGFSLPELIITLDGLHNPYYFRFQISSKLHSRNIHGSAGVPTFRNFFGLLDSHVTDYTGSASSPVSRLQKEPKTRQYLQPKIVEPLWVTNSRTALEKGDSSLCPTGVGGTYFVYQGDEKISVFKPIDEEPGAVNNPKNSLINPILPSGKGANREVAAYALDHTSDMSFAGIPETCMIEVNTPAGLKKGSLQKYIVNAGDCSDLGANKFSTEEVHRIGVFDIRSLNMDRNDENLLVQVNSLGEHHLIPIDHTYCFPEKIDAYFTWQYWSQAKKPFSKDILSYIESIDVISDAKLLIQHEIDEISVRNVVAATMLLQKNGQERVYPFSNCFLCFWPR